MRAAGEPKAEVSAPVSDATSLLTTSFVPKMRAIVVRAWSTIDSSLRKTPCVGNKHCLEKIQNRAFRLPKELLRCTSPLH